MLGVLVSGMAGQGLAVGVEGAAQIARPRERVSTIVVVPGGIAPGERLGRFVVAAPPVERGAAPPVIGCDRGRAVGIALLDRTRRLLIGPGPQVRELERPGIGDGKKEHQRPHEKPTAAKCERRHRQQRQHEPGSFVAPLVGGSIDLLQRPAPRIVHPGAEQPVDVGIVRGDRREPPLAGSGHRAQRRHVDPRHHDLAARALEKAALGQRHRRTLFGAHREHRYADAASGQGLGRVTGSRTLHPVGDENDLADGGAALVEKFVPYRQPEVRAAPLYRDDPGVDGREQMDEGVGVAGERGHDECIAREDHEPGAAVAAAPEEVGDLVARTHQARRGQIARIHGARDVEHDHPGREGAEHRLLQPLERGTGEGESRDDHREGHHRPRPLAPRSAGSGDEVREQRRIHDRLPGAAPRPVATQPPYQGKPGGDRRKPPRTDEDEIGHPAPSAVPSPVAGRFRPPGTKPPHRSPGGTGRRERPLVDPVIGGPRPRLLDRRASRGTVRPRPGR